MSRRVINKISEEQNQVNLNEQLENLINVFYENKVQADKFKKESTKYNKQIKEYMLDNDLDKFKGKDLQATISVTKKQDFNELRAIEILRENLSEDLFNQAVKTKEYIDFDALEKLTYTDEVDLKLLAPCTTDKQPTITLRVKKLKK